MTGRSFEDSDRLNVTVGCVKVCVIAAGDEAVIRIKTRKGYMAHFAYRGQDVNGDTILTVGAKSREMGPLGLG